MKRILFVTIALMLVFSFSLSFAQDEGETKMLGTVTVIDKGEVTIHSYMAPENSGMVNTQIIETENGLVIIDAQFIRPFAKEAAGYIKSLNKPILRVIISHSHPDHWYGLEFYQDVPIYALAETKQFIEENGDGMIARNKVTMGDMITDIKVVPGNVIEEGSEKIDGLKYKFKKVSDGEAGVQLLITLPKINTLIGQDLLYNDVHLFIGNGTFDGWIDALKKLKKKKNAFDTILVGHGKPADSDIFDKNIKYLETVKKTYNSVKSGEELKSQLIKEYPDYHAPFLLDLSNRMLYPEKK